MAVNFSLMTTEYDVVIPRKSKSINQPFGLFLLWLWKSKSPSQFLPILISSSTTTSSSSSALLNGVTVSPNQLNW
jgi:hypothetical protein